MKLCERKRVAEVQAKKCLMMEVSILRRLNGHPNIIQLYEVIETTNQIVLVLEFAAGGDLLRYVRQRQKLTEGCAQDLFKQLLDGLVHVHGLQVVHRDIKLENLMLDTFGCLKIGDFGVAAVLGPHGRRLTDHCGTPSYIAPEILLEGGYDGEPVDLWSSGVVLYAMLCGRVPFKGEHLAELKRCILRGKFHVPPALGESASEMIQGLLVVEPRRRLSAQEALGHAWLAGIANRAYVLAGPTKPSMLVGAETPAERAAEDAQMQIISKVAEFGFPEAFVLESLREGRLNHATATYQLLAQQAARRRSFAPSCGALQLEQAEQANDVV